MTLTIDTNVLIYAADERELAKQRIARELLLQLERRDAVVALQVVGEYQNALRRRLKRTAHEAAAMAAGVLGAFGSFGYILADVEMALDRVVLGQLGYWDALLVAAAERAGQSVLFSEDMADGARFGRLEIVNPFGWAGISDRARALLSL
jgi:predicted nucleic acid-binding protein